MDAIFFGAIILLIVAGYYSLVVMPKQSAFRRHQHYVTSLQVGDQVITHGGLIVTITELDAEVGVARVRLADGVEVRIITAALLQHYDPAEIEKNAKLGLGIEVEEQGEPG